MVYPHQPVMVREVVRCLVTESDGIYVDATAGSGGHSVEILGNISQNGRLICIDRDPSAVRLSKERLTGHKRRVSVVKANFADMDDVLRELGVEKVNGILLDLGLSSYQIEKSGRGFSFIRDEPLDMRMDPDIRITAYQLVNELNVKEIASLLRKYGEEKRAKSIAKAIVHKRKEAGHIHSSLQLANLIRASVSSSHHPGARHPATRTFQALRIAVNQELKNLTRFMDRVPNLIMTGGRIVILSYHSLEDRIVKQTFRSWEQGCTCPPDFPQCACGKKPLFKRMHKKGIKPGEKEVAMNPRARSAILRSAERI